MSDRRLKIDRLQFDSLNESTWSITVRTPKGYDPAVEPQAEDLPEDVRQYLRDWLDDV